MLQLNIDAGGPLSLVSRVFVIYVTGTAELCRIRESHLWWLDAV